MNNTNDFYDLIIIGGGPAGLTAGIYAARAKLKTLLLEKGLPGGQISTTEYVENYPGFPNVIKGQELAQKMEAQAKQFGLEISLLSKATSLKKKDGAFEIKVNNKGSYFAKTIIIATGAFPAKLNIPGEKELTGRGVSYCATCDGAFFKDKKVIVAGGGNAAIEEALFLTRFASEIFIIHRRDQFRADKILQERILKDKKIKLILDSKIKEILGTSKVEGCIVRNKKSGDESKIAIDGIFVYIGSVPNTSFVKGVLELNNEGYIVTNDELQTSLPGIFAAGDVRQNKLKQVAVAVGEGALAGVSAQRYLEKMKNKNL
ncbi:thioredoxin-disulfide reductase [Candidatus Oleimmundimicrobium sp.]|uniref:thioredoxin-disulfide reductase n=1 Tax=Candidatus Oleimmundimicrobium sp. TaxID=3060597 RepID=UPI002721FEE6|nr:thioredoxin-disulfide reductase [Candidatus Oleimmundimicrobium sp.]MDO8885679.1 thioredoxin-disulfide reductase [Candidatus Oleimmundimicrobium sp.]